MQNRGVQIQLPTIPIGLRYAYSDLLKSTLIELGVYKVVYTWEISTKYIEKYEPSCVLIQQLLFLLMSIQLQTPWVNLHSASIAAEECRIEKVKQTNKQKQYRAVSRFESAQLIGTSTFRL